LLLTACGNTGEKIERKMDERTITLDELQIDDLRITHNWSEYSDDLVIASVHALVTNNSQHHLGNFNIRLVMHDCPGDTISDNCRIIGDETERMGAGIPLGQVRSLESSEFRFYNLPTINGNMHWEYTILDIYGMKADWNRE
jgi:hypothetical protein